MNDPVNFLPWRAQQRKFLLYRWGRYTLIALCCEGIALALVVLPLHARLRVQTDIVTPFSMLSHHQQHAVAELETALMQLEKARIGHEVVKKRKQQLQHWQQSLSYLSGQLPEDIWLIGLGMQHSTVSIEGVGLSAEGALASETVFAAWPGFHQLKVTHITQRNGEIHFGFTLQGEKDDVDS